MLEGDEPDGWIILLLGSVVMIFGHTISLWDQVNHSKRILKKHGLWQDEMIKKKDLPKTDETRGKAE